MSRLPGKGKQQSSAQEPAVDGADRDESIDDESDTNELASEVSSL